MIIHMSEIGTQWDLLCGLLSHSLAGQSVWTDNLNLFQSPDYQPCQDCLTKLKAIHWQLGFFTLGTPFTISPLTILTTNSAPTLEEGFWDAKEKALYHSDKEFYLRFGRADADGRILYGRFLSIDTHPLNHRVWTDQ